MKRKRWVFVLRLMIAFLVVFISVFAFLPPQATVNSYLTYSDVFYHSAAFFILSFLLGLQFVLVHRSPLWILPLVLAFGLFIELIQPCFGRANELKDLGSDLLGTLIALALIFIFVYMDKRKK